MRPGGTHVPAAAILAQNIHLQLEHALVCTDIRVPFPTSAYTLDTGCALQ